MYLLEPISLNCSKRTPGDSDKIVAAYLGQLDSELPDSVGGQAERSIAVDVSSADFLGQTSSRYCESPVSMRIRGCHLRRKVVEFAVSHEALT